MDAVAIGVAIAATLACAAPTEVVRDVPSTWRVGTYSPFAGIRASVYLTVQEEPDALRRAVDALVARVSGAFLLLMPTRGHIDSAIEAVLSRAGAHVVALSDEFVLTAAGTTTARRPIDQVLKSLHDQIVPRDAGSGAKRFFPTPAGASWPQVKMKFRDGEVVSIRVGTTTGVCTYVQMGMADAKSGRPSKQWDLLRAFSIRHGYLDWTSGGADRKNQKRKEILAKDLRAFFRIDEAPFELTSSEGGSGKGWRTRFALEPE